jgi:hypothetical protein
MTGSKSFGVRMPLEMYLKMVEVCSKNGVTQTDLVLYSLNRVGLFSDDFKVGGEVEIQEKIVYRNEPELLQEIESLRKSSNNYFQLWQQEEQGNKNLTQSLFELDERMEKLYDKFGKLKPALQQCLHWLGQAQGSEQYKQSVIALRNAISEMEKK